MRSTWRMPRRRCGPSGTGASPSSEFRRCVSCLATSGAIASGSSRWPTSATAIGSLASAYCRRLRGGRRGVRIRPSASSCGGKAGRASSPRALRERRDECCACSSTTLARYRFGRLAAHASSPSRLLRRRACGPDLRAVSGKEAVVVGAAGEASVGLLVVHELPYPELAAASRAEALLEGEQRVPSIRAAAEVELVERLPLAQRAAPYSRRLLAPRSRAASPVAPRW